MADELEKISVVNKAVKDYRRMRTGFEQATRSIPPGAPVDRLIPRDGFALHGSDDIGGIVGAKRILPSPEGPRAQHGPGVYWWKGFPHESNLRGLQDEGLATSLKDLPNKLPQLTNSKGGHFNPHAQRTSEYALRPKDTAIVDMATRTQNKTLAPLLADAAESRSRVVDTGLFHRARQSQMAANTFKSTGGKGPVPTFPSKAQLIKLRASRLAGNLT